ncbi:MAG: DUF1294 domain-containing protein [Lachnospiraceae bacterium]|nr:DUF1294 domain-containing protein [Lachnospiraceae bacterium]
MDVITVILIYIITLNLLEFALMGMDKWKAKNHAWRIPESTLFILAIIGGSIGAIIGMRAFRHKTRHWHFVYGMPAILIIQLLIIFILSKLPLEFLIM